MSCQPPDAIGYLEATSSATGFGIWIFQTSQEQPQLNKSTQFSKQSLCFPIVHLGEKKIMKSHLQKNFFSFSKAFSLKEKWMFKAPCPPSKIQVENLYQIK